MDSLPIEPANLSVHLPGSLVVFVDRQAWDHAVGYWCHLVWLARSSQSNVSENGRSTWPHPSTALAEIIYAGCGIRGEGKELAFFMRYGVTLHNTLRKQPWFVESSAALLNIPAEVADAQGRVFTGQNIDGNTDRSGKGDNTTAFGATPSPSETITSLPRSAVKSPKAGQSAPHSDDEQTVATAVRTESLTKEMPSASNSGFSFRDNVRQMDSVPPTESSSQRIERMVSEILFFLENTTSTVTRLAVDYLVGTKRQIDLVRRPTGLAYEPLQGNQRTSQSRSGLIRDLTESGATVYASTQLAYPERPDKSRLREIRGFFIPPPGPGVPLQVSQRSVQFFCGVDQPGREAFKLDTGTICIGPLEHVSTPGSFV